MPGPATLLWDERVNCGAAHYEAVDGSMTRVWKPGAESDDPVDAYPQVETAGDIAT